VLTVGEVARLAHVSVRTLHHYDQVGLVRPSGRSRGGYRLYAPGDLDRLQEVLVWRRLGFSLDQIRDLGSTGPEGRRRALLEQRELLQGERERLERLLELVDGSLVEQDGGGIMAPEERFAGLGDPEIEAHQEQYDAEVRERWGETDAYRESSRRTRGYGPAEWAEIKAQGAAVLDRFAELFRAGVPADDPRAMDAAEAARLQIDRWFYPCSREMHAGLGEMYVADERFAAFYDGVVAGLAPWVRDAIAANAARA
jgi:DNA-binding transcriptional MerR regulator